MKSRLVLAIIVTFLLVFSALPSQNVLAAEPSADIAVVKANLLSSVMPVGSATSYRIEVANNGPDDATNVTLTDTLPVGVDFMQAQTSQGSYSLSGNIVTFTLGDLAKDASVNAIVTVIPTETGIITNTATVAADQTDPDTTNNNASATTTIPASYTMVAFSATTYSVTENAGSATITVNLSAAISETATVDYATSDGTATKGSDYTAVTGTLTFGAGETSQSFDVPIIDDSDIEDPETINLALSNSSIAVLSTPATAVLTISDNDKAQLTVAFSAATHSVAENAGLATITVNLSAASSEIVTVDYATSDGTATKGSDYTAVTGTLTFGAGETSQSFDVPIIDDSDIEDPETINLALSNSSNATLGLQSTALLIITDDDKAVAFSAATYSVAENAGSTTITVTLSTASLKTVTVDYATSDGTATKGSDYTAVSGTLTFDAGVTSKSFDVPIIDDSSAEDPETISLALTNPSNAALGSPDTTVLTITDNDAQVVAAATIKIVPGILNISSKGSFSAFIGFPKGFDVRDIVIDTIRCEGAAAIDSRVTKDTLMVKFDKQSLVGVPIGEQVTLTITGKCIDGAVFSGSDTVKVAGSESLTPFQQNVIDTLTERASQGQAVPLETSFEYSPTIQETDGESNPTIIITAKTTLYFDNPAQAGNEKWPEFVVDGTVPEGATGFIKGGNYNQLIKDEIQKHVPDAWDKYEFGYEPRTYTFEEKYTITYPDTDSSSQITSETITSSTYLEEILMGRTIPGPNLDYSISWDLSIFFFEVIDFWAGFKLDWALGIRLPMEVSLTGTAPLYEGDTFSLTSSVIGLNWAEEEYLNAGVPGENGNEFVMRFVLECGVFLEVCYVDVINIGVNVDIDKSSSFTTPFGPGSTFPLPSLDIKIWDIDVGVAYGKIGFSITPKLGSEKFTADCTASGEASGSDSLLYTAPNVPVIIGPFQAIDGPGTATITLNNFEYYFNKFLLDLGLYFYLDVLGIWDGSFTIPITDIDLSALTGSLHIGAYSGTPGALVYNLDIQNVPPTAVIDRSNCVVINDVCTFLLHPGEELKVSGNATDPGNDDLTLSWDWDDGAPSPDIMTSYVVPHDVSENQTHIFEWPGLYWVSFKVFDGDAYTEDRVPVIVTTVGNRARSEGYWQQQTSLSGKTDFSRLGIERLLAIVSHMSAVFNEYQDVSTAEKAYNILSLQQNNGDARLQLDRELLIAWLNFANGAYQYLGLLDTDNDGAGDKFFHDLMADAEGISQNSNASKAEIKAQIKLVHHVKQMTQ